MALRRYGRAPFWAYPREKRLLLFCLFLNFACFFSSLFATHLKLLVYSFFNFCFFLSLLDRNFFLFWSRQNYIGSSSIELNLVSRWSYSLYLFFVILWPYYL
ncbi:unnamed protein product [Meloidogyne enterolobii]|uniref:Uncharacterized protein n=1 Tax=Meloidogyne enterolobii TaxID=390850 RepID=A0ACB1B9J6_MELEN